MRMEDNGIDEDTVSEFKEAFELLDEAKKGSISKQDLKLAFKKYGVRVAEESLDEAFKEADVDKNGLLEFSEFFTVMTRKMRKASTEEKVRQAFQAFDPENRGYIPKAVWTLSPFFWTTFVLCRLHTCLIIS